MIFHLIKDHRLIYTLLAKIDALGELPAILIIGVFISIAEFDLILCVANTVIKYTVANLALSTFILRKRSFTALSAHLHASVVHILAILNRS